MVFGKVPKRPFQAACILRWMVRGMWSCDVMCRCPDATSGVGSAHLNTYCATQWSLWRTSEHPGNLLCAFLEQKCCEGYQTPNRRALFLGCISESRICFSLWPGNNLNQNGGPVKQPPGCFTGELCVQAAQNRNGILEPYNIATLTAVGL